MKIPSIPKIPKISNCFFVQFIPIVLITLFLLHTRQMVKYSRTILGKILAVIIVVFYSFIDPLYGALCCGIIILFYQSIFEFNQYTEGMDTNCNKNENNKKSNELAIINNDNLPSSSITTANEWKYIANNIESSNLGSFTHEENCLISNGEHNNGISGNINFEEGMVTYSSIQNEKRIETENENKTKERVEFENNHCDNGILRYKGAKVNLEMASLVLPQLRYKGKTCNPCDSSCEYNIDNKLMLENEMIKPRNSNSWFQSVWDTVWKSNQPVVQEYEGKINNPVTVISE